jgi:hypothetical protein
MLEKGWRWEDRYRSCNRDCLLTIQSELRYTQNTQLEQRKLAR